MVSPTECISFSTKKIMSFQKTHSNYNNGGCIHKRSCRYILEGLITDRRILSPLNALTLPALEFEIEQKLLRDNKYCTLNMCEINPEVYKKQKKHKLLTNQSSTYTTQSIHHYNHDVFELSGVLDLNFVWLDLCSYLTESLFTKLINFLSGTTFLPYGVFAITLMSSRECKDAKKFYSRLQRQYLGTNLATLQNFKQVQLPKILEKVLDEHTRRKHTLQANYTYRPSSGGGIMTMYAYSWSSK
jgi:hypothetical protein